MSFGITKGDLMKSPIDRIIARFKEISAIPRCSKNEAQIRSWVIDWADRHQLSTSTDSTGNLAIKVPASSGFESAPAIVLQGHLDMVCEKTPGSRHDFSRDPIQLIFDEEWLRAKQTTLGADNGIAIALALALVEDQAVCHPPLELLFTVDEESGLNGAKKLDPKLFDGQILLNLDSETEGEFTIGCAGGMDTHISFGLQFDQLPESFSCGTVKISGLRGGHSGIDIHKGRASGNMILARLLYQLADRFDQRIISIQGGTAHNAISRDAQAVVAYPSTDLKAVDQQLIEMSKMLQKECEAVDPELTIEFDTGDQDAAHDHCFTEDTAATCLNMLVAIPHGPITMSPEMPDLVETSTNFAIVKTTSSTLDILTSQRSSVVSRLNEISARIEALARLAEARVRRDNSYPPWQPDPASALLDRCKAVFRQRFDADPKIAAIHAGLECALIGDASPGMQMISFGPTIEDPHSPNERLYIPSLESIWVFLTALLASYKDP